jgi:hypothetical protein
MLGHWVNNQRTRRSVLSAERIGRLEALGFIWNSDSDEWEEGFEHLEALFRDNLDCRVPDRRRAADGYPLGKWVSLQRKNQNELSEEQKARLDALRFEWDPRKVKWEEGFEHLKAYHREKGDCLVEQ